MKIELSDEQVADIRPRRPYLNDPEEAVFGFFESDRDWVENNLEPCVWFLTQVIGDTSE